MWLPRSASKCAVCLAVSASIWGQNADTCGRTIVVNVRDQQNRLVAGLQQASFRAAIDGKPLNILSERLTASPPRVVLLLDQSRSVNRSNHNWEAAVGLADDFVKSNSGRLRIALVLFSDHIIDTLNFDRSPKDMLQRLKSLEPGKGPTALYDSLLYAVSLFQGPEAGDAVYVVSDGGDNRSKSNSGEVERQFLLRGVRLFSFVLIRGNFVTQEERFGWSELLDLAKTTGGMVVGRGHGPYSKEHSDLQFALQSAYNEMSQYYELTVELPTSVKKPTSWAVEAVDGAGRRLRDADLTYPRSLVPCELRLGHN